MPLQFAYRISVCYDQKAQIKQLTELKQVVCFFSCPCRVFDQDVLPFIIIILENVQLQSHAKASICSTTKPQQKVNMTLQHLFVEFRKRIGFLGLSKLASGILEAFDPVLQD